jgi:colanic acid/amylovoran biosynthesis glycosyltransferase
MKILQVCSANVLGGGEVHVIELTEKLRELGHQVQVAGRPGGPLDLDYELGFHNALDLYTAFKLRRIIAREGFDVVHAHVARDYPIVAMAMLGLAGPKLVLTRQLIFRVKAHPAYRRVDGWIVTTTQILASIKHLSPRVTTIVPNWVDSAKMPYQPSGLRQPIKLGLLGQISPHKGHDDAISAMRELGDGFRLLIGGRGQPDYERSLKDRARDLPVEFLGFVKPARFLQQIDMLVVPSWEEPFGIVVVEAMASGVNVIATDAGGPPEILDHGRAGILVPPRNPTALADAVRDLATKEALRKQLREEARKRVESRYDINLTVPRIEQFYDQLGGP